MLHLMQALDLLIKLFMLDIDLCRFQKEYVYDFFVTKMGKSYIRMDRSVSTTVI